MSVSNVGSACPAVPQSTSTTEGRLHGLVLAQRLPRLIEVAGKNNDCTHQGARGIDPRHLRGGIRQAAEAQPVSGGPLRQPERTPQGCTQSRVGREAYPQDAGEGEGKWP